MTTVDEWTAEVARQLEGVFFFSVASACKGCDTCELPDDATDEDYEMAREASFSWSSCDSCGSSLGGDRHPAHGVIADTETEARGGELTHFSVCVDCVMYHANGDVPDNLEVD